MTNLRPNDARVIVKPIEEESVRPSGLVMPEIVKQKPTRGEIVAVGPGAMNDAGARIPLDFEVGQVVVYDRYAGLPYKTPDGELIILRAHDVLAVEVAVPAEVTT